MSKMTIWFVDETADAPVQTTCDADKFGFPNRDDADRKMFVNTHFTDPAEAMVVLLANAEGRVKHAARQYEIAKRTLVSAQTELAEESARLQRIKAQGKR